MADDMGSTQTNGKLNPEVSAKPKRRQHTAEFKRKILEATDLLEANGGGVGALLRKEGLYWSQLSDWRRARAEGGDKALRGEKRGRPVTAPATTKLEMQKPARRVVTLERELQQAKAIIEIQKKVAALLSMPEALDDDESVS